MRKHWKLASFIAGCALLFLAFGIGWAGWWDLSNQTGIIQGILVTLGIIIMVLIIGGIFSPGQDRWSALALAAILILGLDVCLLADIGLLIAPIPLALLVFSLWKRRSEMRRRKTNDG